MHSRALTLAVTALLAAVATAQDVNSICKVSPAGCTIGATACPTGCSKSARCKTPCPPQKTTVVTYTTSSTVTAPVSTVTPPASTITATVTRFRTRTRTSTVTADPAAATATCASQVPYINLFTFEEQSCATLVDADFGLLCLLDPTPQVNFTFQGPVNKINTPILQTLPGGQQQYPQSECVPLAVQNSRSAIFFVDGTDGTNITSSDCLVTLFVNSDCTGVTDSYNINKAGTCQSISKDDDPWKSAYFSCSFPIGPTFGAT